MAGLPAVETKQTEKMKGQDRAGRETETSRRPNAQLLSLLGVRAQMGGSQ